MIGMQLEQRAEITGVEATTYFPGAQIDHYEVLQVLGHGGMSCVYQAIDLQDQRKVVLKFLDTECARS